MTNYLVTNEELTSLADVIREKSGKTGELIWPEDYSETIENISTKVVSVPAKEVNFRDYDGTVVYSYTPAEFATLEAMPANPDHSHDEIPLTAQGWNWSLADAQAYVAKYGRLEVGQMYITTDGKTHIKIYIDPDTPANRMTFYLRWTQSVSNGVTVDWGDGSTLQTYSGTSAANHSHTYSVSGWYDITLTVTSGAVSFVGAEGTSGYFIGGSNGNDNMHNKLRVRHVRFGNGLANSAIGEYCFYQCYALETVTIPVGITSIDKCGFYACSALNAIIIPIGVISLGQQMFASCYMLEWAVIPSSVTTIGIQCFYSGCYNLGFIAFPNGISSLPAYCISNARRISSVFIPDTVTMISNNIFSGCYNLYTVDVPSSVNTIFDSAFYNCFGMVAYHFRRTKPPTLNNTNVFNNIPADCIIYVPRGSLNAYKTATNWSTYASHMQEEPE